MEPTLGWRASRCRNFACAATLVLAAGSAHGEDAAFQAMLVEQGRRFNATYQACLAKFPPNFKESLRVAQRAWIVFDNKSEEAMALAGKRKGMSGEDLERAFLPETLARGAMLRDYFLLPDEDLATLRQEMAQADQELTVVYQRCIATLARDEERKLREAERAWIEYRDKDARARPGDATGRAPVWAALVIIRRRTADLREFYLQRLAGAAPLAVAPSAAPPPALTPPPPPPPPRLDPATRKKLLAELADAANALLAEANASGALAETASLEEVKALPAPLPEDIRAFGERAAAERGQLGPGDAPGEFQAELDTAEAFATLQKSAQDILAANALLASSELGSFERSHPAPATEAQRPLWNCLHARLALCRRLEEAARPHRQRAEALANAGRTGDALREYQEAYRIFPDPNVALTLKRLREDSLGL